MTANSISTVTDSQLGTPALVERYLEKELLAQREFVTPLANSAYGTAKNLPIHEGQYVKFTRPNKLRLPEVAKASTDPLSYAPLKLTQINVPVEFINDHTGFEVQSTMTSWLDLTKLYKEQAFEALRRYQNRAVQAAFVAGRFTPGYRNAAGATDGSATYPNFWTTPAASYSPDFGGTFTFQVPQRVYANGKGDFASLANDDYFTMDFFRQQRVQLAAKGARKIGGRFVAVISDAVQADLERDKEYFDVVKRQEGSAKKLFEGEVADYAGFRFVLDDEPWILGASDANALDITGNKHVVQIFGEDAFGWLRLGGKSAGQPTFKVQDISTTGKLVTYGFMVPFQAMILNTNWCRTCVGAVRDGSGYADPGVT